MYLKNKKQLSVNSIRTGPLHETDAVSESNYLNRDGGDKCWWCNNSSCKVSFGSAPKLSELRSIFNNMSWRVCRRACVTKICDLIVSQYSLRGFLLLIYQTYCSSEYVSTNCHRVLCKPSKLQNRAKHQMEFYCAHCAVSKTRHWKYATKTHFWRGCAILQVRPNCVSVFRNGDIRQPSKDTEQLLFKTHGIALLKHAHTHTHTHTHTHINTS